MGILGDLISSLTETAGAAAPAEADGNIFRDDAYLII